MKNKSKHAYPRKRKEFRFHSIKIKSKSGKIRKMAHPAYVFLKSGNIFFFVTLTHSSKVGNYLMVELRKNPNPKDNSKSYYVAEIKEDTIDNFRKIIKNWKIDDEDDNDIRELYKKR